jgi:hypothetical protein
MQQPQTLTDQPKPDLQQPPLMFSENLNHEQLALWLINHPKIMGKGYQHNISQLKGTYALGSSIILSVLFTFPHYILDAQINGDVFLSLNESRLERFKVSLGFQFAIMNIIEDLVCDIIIIHTC